MNSGTKQTLLIVDADQSDQQLLQLTLVAHGYQVFSVSNGSNGLRYLLKRKPDLALVSLILPDFPGEQFCRRLRNFTDIPLIFMTEAPERAAAHFDADCGLTAVVGKPLAMDIILGRVHHLLEQAQPLCQSCNVTVAADAMSEAAAEMATIPIIDHAQRLIVANGNSIKLSAIEYRLLTYLLDNAGPILSHRQIVNALWGEATAAHINHLYHLVSCLRKKLADPSNAPKYLLSEYGEGYRFNRAGLISWRA